MNKLTESDLRFLARAVALATVPIGAVSPNPYVGAVIVKSGKIIGEGFHAKAGTAHAEVVAIANATESTEGATIYVSLEPCCHHGKTGPCTEAILKAGIARVVYATEDPNPNVAGRGKAFLQAHGIEVICADDPTARAINRIFFHNQLTQSTFVTLKAGLSLDGKIASKTGDSQWITCQAARRKAHELRAMHDAILIGKRTLLNDDPALTVRLEGDYRNPVRIVLLRNFDGIRHANYQIFETTAAKTLIIHTNTALMDDALKADLTAKGVMIHALPAIDPATLLSYLYAQGIMSVLLEGGSSIYNAFLSAGKVDELALFYGPRLIGDDAPSLWDHSGITQLSDAPILNIAHTERLGQSIYVQATFKEVE
ncbi:bifunctional diaminohydroxyphosphoribosylaminopyrimidine deaminase/5-amino-6-(5-phosphoribosylamino)uracil reductase RibD [Wohlfahrtiimonas chitiniclastica]|uniref:bifunctional diaminohydroxyphosphoribosylaminopyrimidine deaminase/5-amino-6-(5-phosphoribosylamino)uracil reductase RibD n=1 Tax=Wohlfahrtiimonas chitiniclastica TaxID=400946 RepID=UPI000B9955A6|nr:bifunctional diaminohydroxyphosphoribosylaminopyrimidine deaminase/5-amino-6-(5-phosphoribosylamino)uracil reductase RibD [Wohlfahrtiimonas chitiniclastica]MBS7816470.1 bifunctional diaminohydroxyphosphoribosylaminopyrimidine deaminase/5-amino-6-(5-phosphoribosylamino)uracil reductase RibD [Wohlfahrtiimonas chitiniclastica]MBS7822613.1 bifunctional diaminohydroxyphosphoribosylaminopyrimidine deaminase/5-amino-6-(5-phosphoribosylamino)uracil reductase RibD [Wohlfahrtiimonas chitiniclastica]MBS